MRQDSYRGVGDFELIAALYNCARRQTKDTAESNSNPKIFISPSQLEEYLVATNDKHQRTGGLVFDTLKFEGVEKPLGISIFPYSKNVVSGVYDKAHKDVTVSMVVTVLLFFKKNRITQGYKNNLNLYAEAQDGCLIKLRNEAVRQLCETFCFTDINYMSINLLYKLVKILDCEKNELNKIFNTLSSVLDDPDELILFGATWELQDKATQLINELQSLVEQYAENEDKVSKPHTLSC